MAGALSPSCPCACPGAVFNITVGPDAFTSGFASCEFPLGFAAPFPLESCAVSGVDPSPFPPLGFALIVYPPPGFGVSYDHPRALRRSTHNCRPIYQNWGSEVPSVPSSVTAAPSKSRSVPKSRSKSTTVSVASPERIARTESAAPKKSRAAKTKSVIRIVVARVVAAVENRPGSD